MRRRGESVLFCEMVVNVRLVMLVYKPERASVGAGWPIGGTDATSFWKVAAAATAHKTN